DRQLERRQGGGPVHVSAGSRPPADGTGSHDTCSSAAVSATAMKMKISGCTVIEYRMFVSTTEIVSGTYTINASGSSRASRCRHAITIPATNNKRYAEDTRVAAE